MMDPPGTVRVIRVSTDEEILATRKLVDQIHVDEKIRDYIVKIVFATRKPQDFKLDVKHFIQFGASPRATIYLTLAAKAPKGVTLVAHVEGADAAALRSLAGRVDAAIVPPAVHAAPDFAELVAEVDP